jgi:probable rRNA maturation factor
MPIHIQNLQTRRISLKGLRSAACRTLAFSNRPRAAVSVLLADDETLHRLNLEYRGIDKPTDVLSFALEDDTAVLPHAHGELGDVVISVPYAARAAQLHGRTLQQELELLTVHGVLHLLGYEDDTEEGVNRMRRAETLLGVRPEDEDSSV